VLSGIDLTVPAGERLAVVGPSGCGKSTLLRLVAGLEEPARGRITGAGLDRCALMPQRDLLLPWRSALDNAALALEARGVPRAQARDRARPLFAQFGLDGFAGARPSTLSGGMRQRVAFLRTLLADKPVLLLDEPFASLDAITREELREWLADALAAEPRTVVLVTHDVEEALRLAARVVVLSARPGRVLLDRTTAGLDREQVLEALR
jgi:ABC-type nitrate/sulfonate/bicarbonate transport system ATPase subunit